MKDSEILDQCADDVSRPNGWRQGSTGRYTDQDAPVCMAGAVYRYGDIIAYDARFKEIVQDLPPAYKLLGVGGIPSFNDAPERTAGEVADAFRTTAKRLREDGR
jgi:hypothetical protein